MVSVIIPAFNEAKTIGHVVSSVKKSHLVGEIIVVDDGSKDQTSNSAERAGAKVIRLAKNIGKGNALNEGVKKAKNEVVVFLDGDLRGVSPDLIRKLALPVIQEKLIMCIAIRDLVFRRLPPVLSGLRALKKSLWFAVPPDCREGFKVEIALNYFGPKMGRVGYRRVHNIKNTIKEKKYGILRGAIKRTNMMIDLMGIGMFFYVLPKFSKEQKLKILRNK